MPRQADEAQIKRVQDLAKQGNMIDPALGEVKVLPVPPPPTTWYGKIFRAVGFQMVIVALLAFAGPGMVRTILLVRECDGAENRRFLLEDPDPARKST
jgi:hypothetical protein